MAKSYEEMVHEKLYSTMDSIAFKRFAQGHHETDDLLTQVVEGICNLGMSLSEAKGFLEKVAFMLENQPLSGK